MSANPSQGENQKSRRRPRKEKKNSTLTPLQKQEISRIIVRNQRRQQEQKFVTAVPVSGGLTASYQVASICDMAQGLTDSTRVGDSIRPISLHIMFTLAPDLTSVVAAQYARVIVFQWMDQFSVNPPSGSNLFLPDPTSGTVTFRSQPSVDARSSIRWLYNEAFALGTNNAITGPHLIEREVSLARAKKSINFVAASSTDGFCKLYAGAICSTATAPIVINLTSKLVFTDA